MTRAALALALAVAAAACGSTQADGAATGSAGSATTTAGSDAPTPPTIDLPARPLGLADLTGYRWRKGRGHLYVRSARGYERHAEWAQVRTECQTALGVDPTNLEAAWLLAAASGATDTDADVLAPLQLAVAGDFGKWGDASLELPQLQRWLATSTGQAYRRWIEAERAPYAQALARSIVVASDGDLYAYDPAAQGRWYRLTRTYGGVVGALALPDGHHLAYVARARAQIGWSDQLGVVDLASGHATKPMWLAEGKAIVVEPHGASGASIRDLAGHGPDAFIDDAGKLVPEVPGPRRPVDVSLRVTGRSVRLDRRAKDITADFDDRGLASQLRLDPSKRVVSVPSPGQIDGSSIAWSPDRVHLALIAQLEDRCQVGARAAVAAYVVDAATGVLRIVERASGGLAVEWLGDGRLVVAGDHGVSVYDLDHLDKPALAIPGATDLVTPRRVPRCVPADDDGSAGSGVDEDIE